MKLHHPYPHWASRKDGLAAYMTTHSDICCGTVCLPVYLHKGKEGHSIHILYRRSTPYACYTTPRLPLRATPHSAYLLAATRSGSGSVSAVWVGAVIAGGATALHTRLPPLRAVRKMTLLNTAARAPYAIPCACICTLKHILSYCTASARLPVCVDHIHKCLTILPFSLPSRRLSRCRFLPCIRLLCLTAYPLPTFTLPPLPTSLPTYITTPASQHHGTFGPHTTPVSPLSGWVGPSVGFAFTYLLFPVA